MPCPNGVSIPGIFSIWNDSSIFGMTDGHLNRYNKLISDEKDASRCIECGECETACPQSIDIIDKLKEADEALREV
jgi:predicted aldo/keto reductase-like oxidoreductase